MAEEESMSGVYISGSYRKLRMSLFEKTIIGAMLLTLTIAMIDAMDGQQVGKSDALAVAKLQGQQELMAAKLK